MGDIFQAAGGKRSQYFINTEIKNQSLLKWQTLPSKPQYPPPKKGKEKKGGKSFGDKTEYDTDIKNINLFHHGFSLFDLQLNDAVLFDQFHNVQDGSKLRFNNELFKNKPSMDSE